MVLECNTVFLISGFTLGVVVHNVGSRFGIGLISIDEVKFTQDSAAIRVSTPIYTLGLNSDWDD